MVFKVIGYDFLKVVMCLHHTFSNIVFLHISLVLQLK